MTGSLREEFLELLEKDKEFRYIVAAKIGLLEILEKLEKHDEKFNEIIRKIEKNSEEIRSIWSELKKIWGEIEKIWNTLEKIWKRLEEHDQKFNVIIKRLEEHDRKFNEILGVLERHGSMLGSLGEDLGAFTEATLSRFVKDELLEEIKVRDEKVLLIKRMYVIDDYEIDLYIETDKQIYIVEVKTRPGISDIDHLIRIKDYLSSKTEKKIKPILATLKRKTTLEVISRSKRENIELILY